MKIFKATTTLDGLLPPLDWTSEKSDAEALLVGGKSLDLTEFPNLRGIFKCGVGTDNLPFAEAALRNILIRLPSEGTRDIIFSETASFACHLILQCLYSGTSDWKKWHKAQRPMLSERRLLVIGVGRIGGRVARQMEGFLEVCTYDNAIDPPAVLEERMRAADIVSLHIPLLAETVGFLDAEKLGWLTDGSWVVNTARGGIIDERALFEELSKGRLGAALDVWWQEPYHGKLNELPNDGRLIRTPHVASTSREFLAGLGREFLTFIDELASVPGSS